MTERADRLGAADVTSPASKLAAVGEMAQREFSELVKGFPKQFERGGTLLLGRYYALRPRGIVMLGINPGGSGRGFTTVPYGSNCLVDATRPAPYSYWRNARTLFTSTTSLAAGMEEATFAFCCPFRTPNWNGQPRALRDALLLHSTPILKRVIADCAPRLIVIAGVAGEALFRTMLGPDTGERRAIAGSGDAKGTYQWRAYSTTIHDNQVTIAQVPHFSRANSTSRLKECGAWLARLVQE